jgi:lipoprotein
MRKIIFLIAFLVPSVVFSACMFDDGDDRDSFTQVETDKFITATKYSFPKDTTALELYNCFIRFHSEGTYTVTGTYKRTETATLNGNLYTDTITKNIVTVKIYKSKTEISNLFHVDFITDNNETISNYYEWQHHRDNVWHNNKIDGDIVIQRF